MFSLYTEKIMRDADIEDLGLKIGGRSIADLRYADDTALMASNVTSARRVLHKVDSAGRTEGMNLNAKKTKVMHIKGKNSLADDLTEVKVNGTALEKVDHFKYLGSIKSSDGASLKDVKIRIAMGKQKMLQLVDIWKDKSLANELKLRILNCLILPVVMYGCKAWVLRKNEEDRINAAELWFYRRLLNVNWKQRRTNKSILDELKLKPTLLIEINRRKLRYVGHALRNTKTDIMATVLQGKVDGKRNRGRPSTTLTNNITSISGLRLSEVVHRSGDRKAWRDVVMSHGAATFNVGDADE